VPEEQATGLPHWPLALHVATLLPKHPVWPGAHTPEQMPAMQYSPVPQLVPFATSVHTVELVAG
jgi:hypothetical protein